MCIVYPVYVTAHNTIIIKHKQKKKQCSAEHLSNYQNTFRNYNTHVLRTPFTAINQKAFTISFEGMHTCMYYLYGAE